MLGRELKQAFGQVIQSDFDIEILPSARRSEPDFFVKRATGLAKKWLPDDPYFDISADRQFFQWREVGAFEIRDQEGIYVQPNEGIPDSLVSQPLLGIVISSLLERRGLLCLHGGTVRVGDAAAVMLGHKGAGKSTSVAALLAAGHALLSDDMAAIDCDTIDRMPIVQTGFPALKLWPDTIDALSIDTSNRTSLIHPDVSKLQKNVGLDSLAGPTKLGALFFLERRKDHVTGVQQMSSQDTLRGLMEHASIARFGLAQMGPQHLARFMRRVCRVVEMTDAYQLIVKDDVSATAEIAAVVEKAMMSVGK